MIESFPQVYLLDHEGVIWSQGLRDRATLSRELEVLLEACEAEDRKSK